MRNFARSASCSCTLLRSQYSAHVLYLNKEAGHGPTFFPYNCLRVNILPTPQSTWHLIHTRTHANPVNIFVLNWFMQSAVLELDHFAHLCEIRALQSNLPSFVQTSTWISPCGRTWRTPVWEIQSASPQQIHSCLLQRWEGSLCVHQSHLTDLCSLRESMWMCFSAQASDHNCLPSWVVYNNKKYHSIGHVLWFSSCIMINTAFKESLILFLFYVVNRILPWYWKSMLRVIILCNLNLYPISLFNHFVRHRYLWTQIDTNL